VQPLGSEEIAARLGAHGLGVSPDEAGTLAVFLELLGQWNRVHNLTSIRGRAELVERHLVESLALEPFIRGARVADVGSGAGLPGIPLAIRLPALAFTLIESRRKRASFLRHAAATLGLGNVGVAHGRAESLELPPFTTVLARAVAPPAGLLEVAGPLVAPGGRLVVLTSRDRSREIAARAEGFGEPAIHEGGAGSSTIVVLERALS